MTDKTSGELRPARGAMSTLCRELAQQALHMTMHDVRNDFSVYAEQVYAMEREFRRIITGRQIKVRDSHTIPGGAYAADARGVVQGARR